MKDIEGEVITNAQNSVRTPKGPDAENAGLSLDDVEGFAHRYNMSPAEVFVKFLATEMDNEILQEKQARLAWDWIKFHKAGEEGEEVDSVTFVIKHGSKD